MVLNWHKLEDHNDDDTSVIWDADVDISSIVRQLEPGYYALGEISDVYKCGMTLAAGRIQVVVVKVMRGLRCDKVSRSMFKKDLTKLVKQWKDLSHPNVMECFGTCNNLGNMAGFVLPMCDGTITNYLRDRPSAQKVQMLLGVASGVGYLHAKRVVHADIRGANVLIRNDVPLLMDIGLAPVVNGGEFTVAGMCGRPRWMAPEILDPTDDVSEDGSSIFTSYSDIYALGMTILEVMTGQLPYNNRRYDTVVMLDVIRGVKPNRPPVSVVPDHIWNIITSCWEHCPERRPAARLVEAWLNMARYIDDCT